MKDKDKHHSTLTKIYIDELIQQIKNFQKTVAGLGILKSDLRKSEVGLHRLATVVRDSNDGVALHDFKGRILAWNRGAERIYGWSEAEALEMNILDMVPENKHRETVALMKRLKKGGIFESFETQRLTKNNKILDIWLTTTLLKYESGKPIAIATTERDITQRKKEQEELRRLKESLEIEVEKKARQLKEANEKIARSERLAALGKLAGMIGHELKNPLNIIQMNHYLITQRLDLVSKDKIKKSLTAIEEASQECIKVVDNILAFGRPKDLQLDKTHVYEIFMKSLEKIKVSENVKVIQDIQKNLPCIMGDKDQLEHVFSNIIQNAFQSMPDGGRLILTAHERDGFVEVIFSDSGSGIPRENMEKIFDPLFSTKTKGTGLGLSFCKDVI